jgi:hypothetical protein
LKGDAMMKRFPQKIQKKIWFRLIVVTLVVGILFAFAPTVVTAQDVISGFCPFDVQVVITSGKSKTVELPNGVFLTTGSLKVQLTNLSSGETLDLNVSGPGKNIANSDGTTTTQIMTGPWLLGLPPGVLPDFTPRLFYSKGRVVAQAITATGEWTSLSIQGNVTDICAALSD